jgi:FkbM family methyltransferase
VALRRIALLKIDVEGYEKFVLEGATATLSARRPPSRFRADGPGRS